MWCISGIEVSTKPKSAHVDAFGVRFGNIGLFILKELTDLGCQLALFVIQIHLKC